MSELTDRIPKEPRVTMIRDIDEAPLPVLSAAEAAIYIGDMAASLKRIAAGCALRDLAHRLEGVEIEARAVLGWADSRRSRGAR